MIKGILTFQFELNQEENGDISPEFIPLQYIFANEQYNIEKYTELLDNSDIFSIFYQHTAGQRELKKKYSNYFMGKFKKTSFKTFSIFNQESNGSQFITLSIFDLDDDIEIYENIIKDMGAKLEVIFPKLLKAINTRQLQLVEDANQKLSDALEFAQFQISRLSKLDKTQKLGLIFRSKERLQILNMLYEYPRSKKDLKKVIEQINPNANIDILLDPFLDLNVMRRDWIKGERDKETGLITNQGEYLFLIKDFTITLAPNEDILRKVSIENPYLFLKFKKKVDEFFQHYDPTHIDEETRIKLSNVLLNPDIYDFLALMRYSYYPLDKIPKILSQWADSESILEELKNLEILIVLNDDNKREWVLLQADILPYFFFPEHSFPRIREAYKSNLIPYEVAKKSLDLLEVTFIEKIEI